MLEKIDYFLANKHLWFTDAINNTLEETHAPEQEDAPRSRSGPSEGDALSRRDEEAYKRQLGNMKISTDKPSIFESTPLWCYVWSNMFFFSNIWKHRGHKNNHIEMELLKSQHQVEMEDLRCLLEATGRKRKKRLAPAAGEKDETFEPGPSWRYQPQEANLDNQVSNDFAGRKEREHKKKTKAT